MNQLYGFALMLTAALCYGASGIAIKLGYKAGLHAEEILPLQNMVSILCMWPVMLYSHKIPSITKSQWKKLITQGIIGNMGISLCYFFAAERLAVSLLTIILFSYPALVLLYQIVIEKKKIIWLEVLSLLLALMGAMWAVNPMQAIHGQWDGFGFLLAVGAAVTYGFMNVYGEKLTHELPPQIITTITATVSTIGMVTVLPVKGLWQTSFTMEQWVWVIGSAMLSTVLPMNLMYLGIRRIGAFYASVISVAELPCLLLLAYWILQERMGDGQVVGGLMILASLILLQVQGFRKKPDEACMPSPTELTCVSEETGQKKI